MAESPGGWKTRHFIHSQAGERAAQFQFCVSKHIGQHVQEAFCPLAFSWSLSSADTAWGSRKEKAAQEFTYCAQKEGREEKAWDQKVDALGSSLAPDIARLC